MKKYSKKDQSESEQEQRKGGLSSDQEGLPNVGILRNQNQYTTNSNMPTKTITESPQRQQGLPTQQQPLGYNSTSRAQSQYYDTRSELPIYVPPYLLNQNRPSRRHDYNKPLDYLAWSVANIFICVIVALPALFFSVQTRDLNRAGNLKKAKVNSKRSLILNIIASVVGLLTILLAVILRFALYQLFVHNDINSQNVPIIIAGGR